MTELQAGLGATAAAAVIAGLMVVRWGGSPSKVHEAAPSVEERAPEYADVVRQEFWVLPKPVAVIHITKPPAPAADPVYPVPKAEEPPQEEPQDASAAGASSADVCARHGGWRVEFNRNRHAMWRCAYRRH